MGDVVGIMEHRQRHCRNVIAELIMIVFADRKGIQRGELQRLANRFSQEINDAVDDLQTPRTYALSSESQ